MSKSESGGCPDITQTDHADSGSFILDRLFQHQVFRAHYAITLARFLLARKDGFQVAEELFLEEDESAEVDDSG